MEQVTDAGLFAILFIGVLLIICLVVALNYVEDEEERRR